MKRLLSYIFAASLIFFPNFSYAKNIKFIPDFSNSNFTNDVDNAISNNFSDFYEMKPTTLDSSNTFSKFKDSTEDTEDKNASDFYEMKSTLFSYPEDDFSRQNNTSNNSISNSSSLQFSEDNLTSSESNPSQKHLDLKNNSSNNSLLEKLKHPKQTIQKPTIDEVVNVHVQMNEEKTFDKYLFRLSKLEKKLNHKYNSIKNVTDVLKVISDFYPLKEEFSNKPAHFAYYSQMYANLCLKGLGFIEQKEFDNKESFTPQFITTLEPLIGKIVNDQDLEKKVLNQKVGWMTYSGGWLNFNSRYATWVRDLILDGIIPSSKEYFKDKGSLENFNNYCSKLSSVIKNNVHTGFMGRGKNNLSVAYTENSYTLINVNGKISIIRPEYFFIGYGLMQPKFVKNNKINTNSIKTLRNNVVKFFKDSINSYHVSKEILPFGIAYYLIKTR